MKTKRIAICFFLGLITIITFCLHSCRREEYCSHCYWECDFDPLFGGKEEHFCADSYEECEMEVLEFLDGRMFPDCWNCSEPR